MDHNDLYVLDLKPSLKTLCMLQVNKHQLNTQVNRVLFLSLSWSVCLSLYTPLPVNKRGFALYVWGGVNI